MVLTTPPHKKSLVMKTQDGQGSSRTVEAQRRTRRKTNHSVIFVLHYFV
jgi:hypothetical protein